MPLACMIKCFGEPANTRKNIDKISLTINEIVKYLIFSAFNCFSGALEMGRCRIVTDRKIDNQAGSTRYGTNGGHEYQNN